MLLCGHCAKEIMVVGQEPDIEYAPGDSDEVIDMGIVDVYAHVHSNKHLCDSGKTGAHPMELLIDPENEKEMTRWDEMRKRVVEDEEKDKKYQEQIEHECRNESYVEPPF